MRKAFVLLLCLSLTGCTSMFTGLPKFTFGDGTQIKESTSISKIENTQTKNAIVKVADADKKIAEAQNKMELEYAKFRTELQKAYDDKDKLNKNNLDRIANLNYGIYYVTQEKKKQDINTLIAHLRAKEIMNKLDNLSEIEKDKVNQQIVEEKTKTIDELYTKYNAQIELAVAQKAELDRAEALIAEKEKEKEQLRTTQKITIEKLQADKVAELKQIKADTDNKVKLATAEQREELLSYIVKALAGVGILFLILGILLRSISLGIGAIACLSLAYVAATIPIWVIGTVLGVVILILLWEAHSEKIKAAVKNQPQIIQVQSQTPPKAQ
jgi:multidrug efflux pump subunit AcrB